MTVNRFFFLLLNLYLNDNSSASKRGEPSYDKLYKIRSMINQLSQNILTFYKPTKQQSIDKSMIKCSNDRSTLKQFIPQKPIKRGFKILVRADVTSFVCQFQIYTGKFMEKLNNF